MSETIAQVSEATGISRFTLHKAIKDGAFPAIKVGNSYLIDTDSKQFQEWKANLKQRNREPAPVEDGFVHGTFTISGDRKKRLAALVGTTDEKALIEAARAHLYQWLDSLPLPQE